MALQPVSARNQQALSGRSVGEVPAVIVRDRDRRPMHGVVVEFAITAGGGAVEPASRVTDGDGVARLDRWTLGVEPGVNTLTASAAGAQPVTFSAVGVAVPVAMEALSPTAQVGSIGTPSPAPPAVLVRDHNNRPIAGAVVTFQVVAGTGSITPDSVSTDADGIARLQRWLFGSSAEENVVTASIGFVAPVVFRASVCSIAASVTGVTVAGALDPGSSCRFQAGQYVTYHALTLAAHRVMRIEQSSTAFDTYLLLYRPTGQVVAENDDLQNAAQGTSNSGMTVFLAPGNYLVAASSAAANVTGEFKLFLGDTVPDVTGCEYVFVTRGTTTQQRLAPGDCEDDDYLSDVFVVSLERDERVVIEMSSTELDSYLLFVNASGGVLENDNAGPGTLSAQIAYTAPRAGYYFFAASSAGVGERGSYTLVVE